MHQFGPFRIRTQSGQIESPPELAGKWAFEISFWSLDGETKLNAMGPFGAFETQKEAITESKKAARMASEEFEKAIVGKTSGKYFDMKNGGTLRPWDEN